MHSNYKKMGKLTSAWDVDSNSRKIVSWNKDRRELSKRIRRMNRKTLNREATKWASLSV